MFLPFTRLHQPRGAFDPQPGGGGGFDPATLSPIAWYDPSDITTLYQDSGATTPVTADGDPFGYIGDKSGNGNHMVQATAGKRPVYKTTGGLKSLLYTSGNSSAITAASAFTGAYEAVIGLNVSDTGFFAEWLDNGSGSYLLRTNTALNSGSNRTLYENTGGNAEFANAANITYVNSVQTLSYTINAAYVIRLGPRGTGGQGKSLGSVTNARFPSGSVYGLIFFSNNLVSGDRASLDTWMGEKAGIAL
jgi:hypothetical protein